MGANKVMYKAQALVFVILAIFLASPGVSATTYYVSSKGGSDSNTGTTENAPWKTIQKAANTVAAGDKTVVLAGTYDERIVITKSGSPGNLIIYEAQGIVDCRGFAIKADHIRVDGFRITNMASAGDWGYSNRFNGSGVHIEGDYNEVLNNSITGSSSVGINFFCYSYDETTTNNCIVRGNTITYAGLCGIFVTGRSHLIENNDISHSTARNMGDADGVRFFGIGHTFRSNYIHDIYLSEGNSGAHIDCLQTWRTAYNILFERNIFHNPNRGMQGLMCEEKSGETVSDLTFKNNIFIMEGSGYAPGLNIKCGSGGWVENMTIVNNTFVNVGGGIAQYAIRLRDLKGATVKNNIFYNFGNSTYSYVYTGTVQNVSIGYNCIYKTDGVPPSGGSYPNDLWMIDPMFVDFAVQDFHLKSDSPCIDSGISLSEVDNDLDGIPRPQGDGYDIGAFEYKITGRPATPLNLRVISSTKD